MIANLLNSAPWLVSLLLAQNSPGNTPAELANVRYLHGVAIFLQDAVLLNLAESAAGPYGHLRAELRVAHPQAVRIREAIRNAKRTPGEPEGEQFLSAMATVLTQDQMTRFEQVHCQLEGLAALRFSRYRGRLDLTTQQIEQVRELVVTFRHKANGLLFHLFVDHEREDQPRIGEQLVAVSHELDEKILALVNEGQRQAWIDLVGERYNWGDDPQRLACSPDASKLAISGTSTGGLGHFIAVMDRDGANRVDLTDEREINDFPSFAPDGKRILFSATSRGVWDLYLIDIDGSNRQALHLAHYVPNEGARFTADGAAIVFGTKELGIYTYAIATGKVRRIVSRGHRPAVSDDGRHVLYEASYNPQAHRPGLLRVVRSDGTGDRGLPFTGFDGTLLPDGRMAFISGQSQNLNIWAMSSQGTEGRWLTRTGGTKKCLCQIPGQAKLAFMHRAAGKEAWDVYHMNLDGTGVELVATLR